MSGRETSVAEYLESEWLWGLTADEREVLTRVSPLEWLSGPLCNQVLDRNDAGEVLHRVFHDRMLLIPLDRRGDAYRMHGLLRDALQAHFERADAEGVRRVHLRASAWFEAAGDIDRAVHHAVAAGDFDLAERLVVTHTPAALHERPLLDGQAMDRLDPEGQGRAERGALPLCRPDRDGPRRRG